MRALRVRAIDSQTCVDDSRRVGDVIAVPFAGEGSGTDVLSWGQQNIWNAIPDDVIAKPVLLFGEAVGVTT